MEKGSCCVGGCIAKILLVVGGLNWGLVGIGHFMDRELNVVEMLLGTWPTVEAVVYVLVGLAALWKIFSWNKCCGGMCKK